MEDIIRDLPKMYGKYDLETHWRESPDDLKARIAICLANDKSEGFVPERLSRTKRMHL